jgi:uncharacterized SAM-binding protein YcdF (DUF218 family)
LLALAWFLRVPILTAIGKSFIENDGPQKADAIVVLGGDDYGMRIIKAAQLAKAGYAPFVIVSGPPTLGEHESDITIHYAETKGYPACLFHPLPNECNSTREEMAFIGHYLKSQGIHKVILVTSNYHTGRAANFMRSQNPWLWVVVVPAPDKYFTVDGWWKTRGGQKTFFYEALKRIVAWFGY